MFSGEEFLNGQVLLIDKPLGWTSFQVVNKLRWNIRNKFKLGKIKVGHAGTLDPLATGLLIICTGKLTKKIDEYQAQVKEYIGEITLGATTPSFDKETEIDTYFETNHITKEQLFNVAKSFVGEIEQFPPMYSAIKQNGVRMYNLARDGKTRELKKRKVTIEVFEIDDSNFPIINFRVVCSKGTYIRSLVYDFGNALHSGAYLSELRRTKIGNFTIKNALEPADYIKKYLS